MRPTSTTAALPLLAGTAPSGASMARTISPLPSLVLMLAAVMSGGRGASAAPQQPSGGDGSAEFAVWPGIAPGSETWTQKELITGSGDRRTVRSVVRPTLTPFPPKRGTANGIAVVVAPGGAFRFLSWDNEGTKVAEWLSERGVTAFVLKYRLVDTGSTDADFQKSMQELFRSMQEPGGPFEHPETKQVAEMAAEDGRQAIKVVRQQAEKWGINPKRVGIMGFSAGAVVATRVASGTTRTAVRTLWVPSMAHRCETTRSRLMHHPCSCSLRRTTASGSRPRSSTRSGRMPANRPNSSSMRVVAMVSG